MTTDGFHRPPARSSVIVSPLGNQLALFRSVPERFRASRGVWQPTCSNSVDMLDGIALRLEHYMDLVAARQKLVASNIANVDTPGYKTKDIDFHREFMRLAKGRPAAVEVQDLQGKNDGNNVDVDREARLLAENALRFSVASNLLRTQIQAVRIAIQEGKNG